MEVLIQLRGPLKKYGPGEDFFTHSVEEGSCTLYDVLEHLKIPTSSVSFIQVDDKKTDLKTILKGGEVITLYPRVSGG